jgi:hypothetical protein
MNRIFSFFQSIQSVRKCSQIIFVVVKMKYSYFFLFHVYVWLQERAGVKFCIVIG